MTVILDVLVDSGVAGELVEAVLGVGADATQGAHGPGFSSFPGSAAAGGPGQGGDRDGGGGGDREQSDSKRRRDMKRSAAEAALMDAAANYGRAGTATGIINTAVGGGVALATGINEISRNEGRGAGGSTPYGKRAMDAALAEMPQAKPSSK